MKLIHWSPKPIDKVRYCIQPFYGAMKPLGLWVSDEDDYGWQQWCRENGYSHHKGAFDHQYEVTLADDAKIIFIKNAEQLWDFDQRYHQSMESAFVNITSFSDHIHINWEKVAKESQGIIITPYIYRARLGLSWYYGWDCASGCIWDPAAIKSLIKI